MDTRLWLLCIAAIFGCGCKSVLIAETTAAATRPAADAVVIRRIESGAPTSELYRAAPFTSQPGGEDVLVRIVDVGQALCVVGVASEHAFLIDAGHWRSNACKAAIDELLPADEGLALVVLTHNDSDHLGELPEIVSSRGIDTLVWTGRIPAKCSSLSRPECASAYLAARDAIGAAAKAGTTVINLSSTPLEPGEPFSLGPIEVTFVAGWGTYPSSQGMSASEFENAVSIIVRIEAAGGSVLVTGDAIGRPLGISDESTCSGSEGWAVVNVAPLLDADVLVASHHGGNNGSATCFIEAVSPHTVIFSAGSGHGHPHRATVQRFLDAGVPLNRLFRTDRGSNSEMDANKGEWLESDALACGDQSKDDHVDIGLSSDGVFVSYIAPDPCQ